MERRSFLNASGGGAVAGVVLPCSRLWLPRPAPQAAAIWQYLGRFAAKVGIATTTYVVNGWLLVSGGGAAGRVAVTADRRIVILWRRPIYQTTCQEGTSC